MTSVQRDAGVRRSTTVRATADAAEALCFARDLGGSLTHVVVAAAGRALGLLAPPDAPAPGPQVAVLVTGDGQGRLTLVPGAVRAPLPTVRAEVDDAVLRGLSSTDIDAVGPQPALVVIVGEASEMVDTDTRGGTRLLESGPADGDPLTLALALHVGADPADVRYAERLLAHIVRLVERPYRRLV